MFKRISSTIIIHHLFLYFQWDPMVRLQNDWAAAAEARPSTPHGGTPRSLRPNPVGPWQPWNLNSPPPIWWGTPCGADWVPVPRNAEIQDVQLVMTLPLPYLKASTSTHPKGGGLGYMVIIWEHWWYCDILINKNSCYSDVDENIPNPFKNEMKCMHLAGLSSFCWLVLGES